MPATERMSATPDHAPPEIWLPGKRPGEPSLRVRREGEGATASFVLALAGVVRRTEPAEPAAAGWPVLGAGQGLDIVYQVAAGRLECLLRGHGRSSNAVSAAIGARTLWRNLDIDLHRGLADYHFMPSADPAQFESGESGAAPAWRAVLRPLRLRIAPRPPFGYLAPAEPERSALLVAHPPARSTGYFNALTDAMIWGGALEIQLRVRPFQLELRQEALVRAALRDLGATERIHHGPADRPLAVTAELLAALRRELEVWGQDPFGWRMQCVVSAREPVPDALLALLGGELFHGRPVTWEPPAPEAERDEDGLDLGDAVPAGEPPPPLLPEPRRLLERGLPVYYGHAPAFLPAEGVLLGQVGAGRQPRLVRFAPSDRTRHCYILGATGTGKSTLLYNLLTQDIAAGAGVCLLDPHGDLYQQVLAATPAHRLQDVILIEPGDPERAVGINFLECAGPHPQVRMNFITNEMIRIFHRLYDLDRTGGPMFEQYMRNALLLVMDNEIAGGTLMDIPLLFENKNYRQRLLDRCRNEYTVNFWRGQAEQTTGDSSLSNMAPYITSKLNQFTSNALLRPIIGQSRSTVDFSACLDEGRIVLVNLPKGLLGQMDTQLLGMLIIGKLFAAALQRTQAPVSQRRPFFLYVDEAHNFTTETVAHLLAEARKFGLYLTLANQNLTQMGGGLVDAILGNVGSLLLFRLGVLDAGRMAPYVNPELTMRDLEDLPDRHVAARLLLLGAPSRPFVFATLAPQPVQSLSLAEQRRARAVLEGSRVRYTRPIAEVEQELLQRRRGVRR